jgi:hypothetical protein
MYGILGNKAVIALTGWLISAAYLALNWSAASVAAFGLARRLGAPDSPVLDAVIICGIAAVTLWSACTATPRSCGCTPC